MKVELRGVAGLPEIGEGADLAALIAAALGGGEDALIDGDVVVVTQKIVSKAEGQRVALSAITPSPFAVQWAATYGQDPRVVELVLRESRRFVRMDRGVLIAETHHGWVCANAGVDLSNVDGGGAATLLPKDPDASARRIRDGLRAATGKQIAVIVSDTFGRPWRDGLINVALGVAGLAPLRSYVGAVDPLGLPLKATIQALADEIAAASGLVSEKLNRIPVVVVRGVSYTAAEASARDLMRPPDRDFFR